MGYYIAVRCRSVAARDKMLAFMAEHFRHASEIMDWVPLDSRMEMPTNGKDICAYAKPNEIGWYRNAGWDEEHRLYAQCLLRWMAMKVGKTLLLLKDIVPGYDEITVPYTLYDGAPVPIVTREQCPNAPDGWEAEGYAVCDGLGWDRSMRGPYPGVDPKFDRGCKPWLLKLRERKAKADPIIRAELERLEELWGV